MCSIAGVALEEQKRCHDLRGNRTPNLRVWNPTRCHCAMKSNSGAVRASESISKMKRDAATCGIAVLAERLRRTLKARVRKSVGSIPTDCTIFLGDFFVPSCHTKKKNPRNRSRTSDLEISVVAIYSLPLCQLSYTRSVGAPEPARQF